MRRPQAVYANYRKQLLHQILQKKKKNQEWTNQHLWKTALKKFEVIWSPLAYHITSNFLKAVFHKFYCPKDLPWNGDGM